MSWHVKRNNSEIVRCSLCQLPTIYLEPVAKRKIELLMDAHPHQEWLGYLIGEASGEKSFFIRDLAIPPHEEASGVIAKAEPFHIPENCIGVIHSHHGMGAFHSSTDQEYVDKNFPASITVARKASNLEYDAVCYGSAPCGRPTLDKGTVKCVQPEPLFDEKAFLASSRENIDKSKKLITTDELFAYSLPQGGNYVVDSTGRVLTQKEHMELLNRLREKEHK